MEHLINLKTVIITATLIRLAVIFAPRWTFKKPTPTPGGLLLTNAMHQMPNITISTVTKRDAENPFIPLTLKLMALELSTSLIHFSLSMLRLISSKTEEILTKLFSN